MRYVAAYLLATLGGNKDPSAQDIKDILESVGIEADEERLNIVISELKGKDVNEVIQSVGFIDLPNIDDLWIRTMCWMAIVQRSFVLWEESWKKWGEARVLNDKIQIKTCDHSIVCGVFQSVENHSKHYNNDSRHNSS